MTNTHMYLTSAVLERTIACLPMSPDCEVIYSNYDDLDQLTIYRESPAAYLDKTSGNMSVYLPVENEQLFL